MYLTIKNLCDDLIQEWSLISSDRKDILQRLSNYIKTKLSQLDKVQIIVICTHNSRRSHMGQLWLSVAADYYGITNIKTYSGGTEATSFNIRAVEAFRKLGFRIEEDRVDKANPNYSIDWDEKMEAYVAFSKRYDCPPNPTDNFGAIMVCTQADDACPSVSGADFRLSLSFEDPKEYDNTELESEKYTERAKQIGREMLYVMYHVNQ